MGNVLYARDEAVLAGYLANTPPGGSSWQLQIREGVRGECWQRTSLSRRLCQIHRLMAPNVGEMKRRQGFLPEVCLQDGQNGHS